MAEQPHVLMVAAECRDLAKIGGLGDVVRDLSAALQTLAIPVSIIMPGYERITQRGEPFDNLHVQFGARDDWPVLISRRDLGGVPVFLVQSEAFFGGPYGDVYIDSDRLGRGPFEDDAQRFAFFSAAVVEFVQSHPELSFTALHCHDWHSAVALLLLRADPRYRKLASRLQTVFTIHNLDYQGVRPLELRDSPEFASFSGWFPELYRSLRPELLEQLTDRHAQMPCFNPMRAGINLARNVTTVSPTYAREITRPDNPKMNFFGGRGLEQDLAQLNGRLHGILNGLDYTIYEPGKLDPPFDPAAPDWQSARRAHKIDLVSSLPALLIQMAQRQKRGFRNSDAVLRKMAGFDPGAWIDKPLVVCVTRAVRQKLSILFEPIGSHSVLQELLGREAFSIILGTGELEAELEAVNEEPNGLYVAAFDPGFANRLYSSGDLFLMPSDFEPCGISQMIAMRYGCLPLVAGVGGLCDTVEDGRTGFVYSGDSREEARQNLLSTFDRALSSYRDQPERWARMQEQAMSTRFDWQLSAEKYLQLYKQM